jgi:multicomponent K+:H+ antiporter subunit D
VSGLFGAIALMRVGMRHFWTAQDRPAPRLRVIETLPIAGLLAASVALVLQAEPGSPTPVPRPTPCMRPAAVH